LPFYSTAPDVGAAVSDSLATNLMDANLILIERSYLLNVLVERNIVRSEIPDSTQSPGTIIKGVESLDLPKLDALNLVDYLLVGTVTSSMSSMAVNSYGFMGSGVTRMTTLGASARMIDVRTGEVVLSLSYSPATIYDVPYDIGKTMAKAIKKKIRTQ
jgi:curli biogenesis system outer membrane secretion channel CsgG